MTARSLNVIELDDFDSSAIWPHPAQFDHGPEIQTETLPDIDVA
jgi:hypothetical protein